MINRNDRSQSICHHTALLMYHDTGSGTFAADARLFAELWENLVPESGKAASKQGEVLRAVGCLATEDRRNGCMNWGDYFERLAEFLRTSLPNHAIFNADRCARILQDLDAVVLNGRDGVEANEIRTVFGRLIEDAIAYNQNLPTLVATEAVIEVPDSA